MVKILYLEDEQYIREVTQEYLAMAQYDVDCVTDVLEAREALLTNTYDIAILDILVPHGTGFDILEVIHASSANTRCIMLTALDDESSQIKAFNGFADDYMIKPFSPVILMKRLEALMRRRESISSATVSGLVLNPESYEVLYNGNSILLTYTEFLICEALMTHKNRVYTREMLLDIIAPDDYLVSDRVIDAHIKNIRKKSPVSIVRTVVGAGYQYQEGNL